MPVSATLVACIRFFVQEGDGMAKSKWYRRSGANRMVSTRIGRWPMLVGSS